MDLFEAMRTQRALRRLKPDPVPDALIWKVLEAATGAPSGGNLQPWGRKSPHSLYWEKLASFEKEDIYNQKDAEGFINLFGLPLKVHALMRKGKI